MPWKLVALLVGAFILMVIITNVVTQTNPINYAQFPHQPEVKVIVTKISSDRIEFHYRFGPYFYLEGNSPSIGSAVDAVISDSDGLFCVEGIGADTKDMTVFSAIGGKCFDALPQTEYMKEKRYEWLPSLNSSTHLSHVWSSK